MAGNRQVFEQAMRQGTNYAWDKQWNKAIAEYQKAIDEFPQEAPAFVALGQAFVHADRLKEALDVYQRAARLTPNDPLALSRVAELLEQLGDVPGAVKTWLHAADLRVRAQDVGQAVEVWQHIASVAPETVLAHERLAKAYAGMGQNRKAVGQYLALAMLYQGQGDQARATAICQQALNLDPRSADVLTALDALQHGRPLSELLAKEAGEIDKGLTKAESEARRAVFGPIETTRQQALSELAGSLLEDSNLGGLELVSLLLQGIDLQTRGETASAIANYEQVLQGGMRHAAVHFNLGLLYQESLRFEEAVGQLQKVVDNSDYALGAHLALGECFRALGRLDEALTHFIRGLKWLDLSILPAERAKELGRTYNTLHNDFMAARDHDAMAVFVNAVVEFLSDEGWQEKLSQTRQQLNLLSDDRVISLGEFLTLPDAERVWASMLKAQELLEQGLFFSASEEYLWAIQHAPSYLPLHLQLAELFIQSKQPEIAIDKYLFVADTFAVREELEQAMEMYDRVLGMAPMDLGVRQKLIGLLQDHGRIEPALEQRLALADAYYELAQIELSREQYNDALALAADLPDSKKWTSVILHRLGDIDLQRLDWRSAIDVYSELKAAVPEDTKARKKLIELHFNLQHQAQAVAELDQLLDLYRQEGNLQQVLEIVQELSEARPDELTLHKRAAQLCIEMRNRAGAIAHLDAMGELQLQTGHVQEAVSTIRAIVALGPENVDAYRQLLEQIAE